MLASSVSIDLYVHENVIGKDLIVGEQYMAMFGSHGPRLRSIAGALVTGDVRVCRRAIIP